MIRIITAVFGCLMAAVALLPASSLAETVAFDMVNGTSQGLTSFNNPFNGAFSATSDGFQKYQRGVSGSIPDGIADDSLTANPGDSQGVIDELDTETFFGTVDTVNPDNPAGEASASWVFNVAGYTDLSVSIDIGAMGDFESSDHFTWEASLDGGAPQTLFSAVADEADVFVYTLAGGNNFALSDPLKINGTTLNNALQTFSSPVDGTGGELTITFTVTTNGGNEAVVFRNLVVEGTGDGGGEAATAFDMVNSADQRLISFVNDFDGLFSQAGDGFQKYQREVSASIPFSVLDDSLFSFPGDSLGIIDENNAEQFFGVSDTMNNDNSGTVSAAWTFDISGIPAPGVSIDMGAMGDFEAASDFFRWTASVDGGAAVTLFESTVNEAIAQFYTLSGGAEFALDDPMLTDGMLLSNVLKTFTAPLPGEGATLLLTLEASTDGGNEAFAFQNIVVAEVSGGTGVTGATIAEIQGNGDTSPLVGQDVMTTGVVTADFRDLNGTNGKLSGFFIQDPTGDGDDTTSEGLFVFTGAGEFADVSVEPGDELRVTGRVEELGGDFTRLSAVTDIEPLSRLSELLPVAVTLPETNEGELERYEGMLVQIASDMVIAQNFFLDRYGQLTLAAPGSTSRPIKPTNIHDGSADPASDAQLLFDENLRRFLTLDDGQDINAFGDNPEPVPFFPSPADFQAGEVVRAGDGVSNLVGVIDQGTITGFGGRGHRLQAVGEPEFDHRNPRTAAPENVGGSLKLASFNVLNYFVTIDNGELRCGPDLDRGCRGADNQEELERQTAKLVAAICGIDADIVGLIEIENGPAGANPAINALIDAAGDCVGGEGPDLYAAAAPAGPLGGDVITNPFIYKPSTVAPRADAVLDKTVDPRFDTDNQRPAYAVTFLDLATGELFTAVNNHFKSKGSLTGKPQDVDQGDLQGNNNFTRTEAALALVDWLDTDPTGSGSSDVIIIGDLNSYGEEDPLQVIQEAGYTDLLEDFLAFDDAYSFTFDGEVGALDHALASPSLLEKINGVTAWHINTDEAEFTSYEQSFNPDGYFVEGPYRASDHDPIIVGLDLAEPPPLIADLVARASNGRIQLRWTGVPGALGYHVYRSSAPGGPYTRIAAGHDRTLMLDTGLTNGVRYYYMVEVVSPLRAAGSPRSHEVSAMPASRSARRGR